MKRTEGTVPRFSPDWVRMIPRWLVRGIWDAIQDTSEPKEHSHARENLRRKRLIDAGKLQPTGRADDYPRNSELGGDSEETGSDA